MAILRYFLQFICIFGFMSVTLQAGQDVRVTTPMIREDVLFIVRNMAEIDAQWNGTIISRAQWMRQLSHNVSMN